MNRPHPPRPEQTAVLSLSALSPATRKRLGFALLAAAALTLLAAPPARAQVYKHVGPDGRITFSDKPPAAAPASKNDKKGADGEATAQGGSSGALPFELRQIASKYPVTLYTARDCVPCDSGRNHLRTRGIPFAERTIVTEDDAAAMKKIHAENSFPVLAIGGQKIGGYSEASWDQYLDAAGYPKENKLPRSYQLPAATPLAPPKPSSAAPDKPAAEPAAPKLDVAPPRPTQDNPTGIRF